MTVMAQTCAFDDGNSSLSVEGVVLTRYALGITGAPLVANTGINAVDEPTVVASINCPSCGLNITGNPTMTVADATIISRKLAGFSGPALTNGIALGSGTRNTPAAVQSFLLAGCGATGGTVTSVTAGTGLAGGPITTTGALSLASSYQLPQSCANGQVPKSNGAGGWACAPDLTGTSGSSGTVTSVATGAGLTGGPITGTGSIGLAASQLLPTTTCGDSQTLIWNSTGSNWICAPWAPPVAGSSNAFVNGGNAFTSPAVLGTSNGQPLSVGIGGGNGLRIFPSSQAGEPVLISGSAANFVTGIATGSEGATISGGGSPLTNCGASANLPCANAGAGRYSTIGGGFYNRTSGQSATVAGGSYGYASAFGATVGGGGSNTASAGGSTVAGGTTNEASGTHSAIGGGLNNKASESNATIAGGTNNFVSGLSSAVGGGSDNLADGSSSTIAGGATNSASGPSSAIGGGSVNRAIGSSSTIAGGVGNAVSGESSAIGGGSNNVVRGIGATIAGGGLNVINGQYGAIPGGLSNTALGAHSFAAGRNANAVEDQSFVWNGRTTAKSSGGVGTVQFASPSYIELDTRSSSTAGAFLTVHGALDGGVVAMGSDTKGVDIYGPGSLSFVSPTTRQTINLYGADYGIGVSDNTLYSRSAANFCWIRGGIHANPTPQTCYNGYDVGGGTTLMHLIGISVGGLTKGRLSTWDVSAKNMTTTNLTVLGTFDNQSDRASKENFRGITPKSVLAKVAALPIALWNYKEDDLKRTHMGPMAQDFHRLFNLGTGNKTIGVIDSAGVALAAIQGLNQVIKEKDAKIEALTTRLKAIEKKLGM
jgi:hypothetical protein